MCSLGYRLWPGLLIAWILGGCASVLPERLPEDAIALELERAPFFPQDDYQCGPAALATVLVASGVAVTAEALVPQVYLPARQGSLQAELIATARRHDRVPYPLGPTLAELYAELQSGRPVLVLQNLGTGSHPIWHYAVVVGLDPERDRMVLRSGVTEREIMPAARFLATWRRAAYWGLVVLPPGEMPARPDPARYLEAVAGLEETGRSAAAETAYAAALARWSAHPVALFGLANSQYAQGDYGAAVASYRRLLDVEPGHAATYHNLAHALAARGCRAAALDALETGRALADAALLPVFQRAREKLQTGPQTGSCPAV